MIDARPFDDYAAVAVFGHLDPNDVMEASLIRGAPQHAMALYAEWRSALSGCMLSLVIHTGGGTPFAVLALAHTGQHGVAQAALLARDHHRFRRPMAELALQIRRRMPLWCRQQGIHRIEARAWADHPTASGFLSAIGFRAECDMRGFGPTGAARFRQFVWLSPDLPAACTSDDRKAGDPCVS